MADELTPQERFDKAQLVQYDLNAVAAIKIGAATNNEGAGIIRILNTSKLNLRPETEASLNMIVMSAINGVLNDTATDLELEFNNVMNPPIQ